RLHGEPYALAHDGFAVGIDRLPAQRAPCRYEGGSGAIGGDPDAAGRPPGIGRVVRYRHRLRDRTAPADVVAVGAHQVRLHDLVVRDVVDTAVAAGGALAAWNAQVVRLLGVTPVAAGLVAGHDQGQVVALQ